MIKILAFMASPNKEGNTAKLLDSFLQGVKGEVTVIYPYKLNIRPCIDCKYCYTHKGKCSIEDDMTAIYKSIEECDVFVIASPMYFASFPGPLKNIIDRTQIFWSIKNIIKSNNMQKKSGILIFTAGSSWNNMFLPMEKASGYLFKNINCDLIGKIYADNTDNLPVDKNMILIENAYNMGRNLV